MDPVVNKHTTPNKNRAGLYGNFTGRIRIALMLHITKIITPQHFKN